jgi:hypothetical protein
MEKFGSGIRDGKNSDAGSGLEKFGSGIQDGKHSDPGIRDKHPGSATLLSTPVIFYNL